MSSQELKNILKNSTNMLLCGVLFSVFLSICVKSEEPRCSKYDFEEKVLEKLVRMEFEMERMRLEIEQSVSTVGNMKKEMDNSLKKQQEVEKNIEDKINEALDEERKELETLKENHVIPTVVFKARLNSDIAAPTGEVIVFPTVLFNEGGAYNSGTGKFIAPVNGTYMFSFALCLVYHKTLVAGIMVDGDKFTVSLFYGDENHECLTGDTVAVLKAGQMVWIESTSGSTDTIIDEHFNRWNTFSGALIHK